MSLARRAGLAKESVTARWTTRANGVWWWFLLGMVKLVLSINIGMK